MPACKLKSGSAGGFFRPVEIAQKNAPPSDVSVAISSPPRGCGRAFFLGIPRKSRFFGVLDRPALNCVFTDVSGSHFCRKSAVIGIPMRFRGIGGRFGESWNRSAWARKSPDDRTKMNSATSMILRLPPALQHGRTHWNTGERVRTDRYDSGFCGWP